MNGRGSEIGFESSEIGLDEKAEECSDCTSDEEEKETVVAANVFLAN